MTELFCFALLLEITITGLKHFHRDLDRHTKVPSESDSPQEALLVTLVPQLRLLLLIGETVLCEPLLYTDLQRLDEVLREAALGGVAAAVAPQTLLFSVLTFLVVVRHRLQTRSKSNHPTL